MDSEASCLGGNRTTGLQDHLAQISPCRDLRKYTSWIPLQQFNGVWTFFRLTQRKVDVCPERSCSSCMTSCCNTIIWFVHTAQQHTAVKLSCLGAVAEVLKLMEWD
jgi:hypothetical protein